MLYLHNLYKIDKIRIDVIKIPIKLQALVVSQERCVPNLNEDYIGSGGRGEDMNLQVSDNASDGGETQIAVSTASQHLSDLLDAGGLAKFPSNNRVTSRSHSRREQPYTQQSCYK